MSNQTEELEGTLSRIVFKNDSGFVIGAFTDKHNNKFTAIGSMINPQINMEYIMSGYWVEDHKYGEQFRFSHYETIMPVDTSGIFKYIVRICKFVGPTIGNVICEKYGDKTLEVMKADPQKLSDEISGITLSRAQEIQTALFENEANEKVMVELESILNVPGMRKSLASDLINSYKSKAAEVIKDNPYILTQFYGISFSLADRVALNVGYVRNGIERKKAATMHCMHQNMRDGSIWIREQVLIENIQILIQVPDLSDGLHDLLSDGVIVCDDDSYALSNPAKEEGEIADIIATMSNSEVILCHSN